MQHTPTESSAVNTLNKQKCSVRAFDFMIL